MLTSLLVVGSFWFWGLIGLETILLLLWIEWEYSGWATFSLIVTALLFQFNGINIFSYVTANPSIIGYGAAFYLAAGTIWSIVKWFFFTRMMRERYDDFKTNFLLNKHVEGTSIPEDLKADFKESLENIGRYSYGNNENKIEIRPQVNQHKAQIYLWMVYWPWSMIWTIINDPVRRVFRWIYTQIRATLQAISDHVWKGTENDFAPNVNRKKN